MSANPLGGQVALQKATLVNRYNIFSCPDNIKANYGWLVAINQNYQMELITKLEEDRAKEEEEKAKKKAKEKEERKLARAKKRVELEAENIFCCTKHLPGSSSTIVNAMRWSISNKAATTEEIIIKTNTNSISTTTSTIMSTTKAANLNTTAKPMVHSSLKISEGGLDSLPPTMISTIPMTTITTKTNPTPITSTYIPAIRPKISLSSERSLDCLLPTTASTTTISTRAGSGCTTTITSNSTCNTTSMATMGRASAAHFQEARCPYLLVLDYPNHTIITSTNDLAYQMFQPAHPCGNDTVRR